MDCQRLRTGRQRLRWARRALAVVAAASTAVLAAWLPQSTAAADDEPPGSIRFVGKNAVATANGRFHVWRITRAELDFERPERSEVEVEVDVASLDTGNRRRDDHLRSDDFFDVAKWPTATVKVHQASRNGESDGGNPRYAARFSLRIRDVVQTVTGEFEVTSVSPLTVEGRLVLDRVDFGIGDPRSRWNPFSIRDEVPVEFTARIPGGD